MARRIEIELTSVRPDGTWTWRAAGAREPKGVLDGKVLFEGAKVGDVLKADAEFELEGIAVISVIAPRSDRRKEPERIEIIGSGRPEGPGVTTQLVGRSDRRERRRDDDRRPDRDRPRAGDGRPRSGEGRARREGPREDRPDRGGGRPRGDGDRPARTEGDRGRALDAGRTRDPARHSESGPRRDGAGSRPARPQGERRPPAERTSSTSDRGRKRLNPASTHRRAVLDSLSPEQQAVAEQVLRGGIPAVRTALHLEREKAEAEGRPAPNTDALLTLAETLLPRLRAAEWRDRAEAAVAGIEEISLRDLRSVAAGADLARDDETRDLANRLNQAIEGRVAKLHTDWVADINNQLDGGRPVRAVRLSARPPDATARLDDELTARLVSAAGATLSPDTAPELWLSMLEAVAESPIRRAVVPAGMPADPPPDLKRTAHQLSGSVPALAKMLGVTIPPPPAPTAARRRPDKAGGRPRPAEGRTARAPVGQDAAVVGPDRQPGPPPADPASASPAPPAAEATAEPSTPEPVIPTTEGLTAEPPALEESPIGEASTADTPAAPDVSRAPDDDPVDPNEVVSGPAGTPADAVPAEDPEPAS